MIIVLFVGLSWTFKKNEIQAGTVAQVVRAQEGKCKALSSNPSAAKKKKKRTNEIMHVEVPGTEWVYSKC
jgi:hypothetical protein